MSRPRAAAPVPWPCVGPAVPKMKRRKLTTQWYEFGVGDRTVGVRCIGRGSWHCYFGKRAYRGRPEAWVTSLAAGRAVAARWLGGR